MSCDHPDLDSGLYQRAHDRAADKAGGAGDENLHGKDVTRKAFCSSIVIRQASFVKWVDTSTICE